MGIDVLSVDELTKSQYLKYSKLNLGDKGLMKYYLKSAFDKEPSRLKLRRNERILSISENNRVIAWVLILEFRACYACRWKHGIHVYTRASHRGKGYASILIKEAIAITLPNRLYCRGNTKFFNKYGIKYV